MLPPPRPGTAAIYQQLAALLRRSIQDGALQPGARLPSEKHLMQTHGLARETVRKAIALLRQEGLVDVEHGHGVTVRRPAERIEVHIQRGATWTVRMPTPEERRELSIPEGVPVVAVTHGSRRELYPGDQYQFRSL